jgi:hypothetical protein
LILKLKWFQHMFPQIGIKSLFKHEYIYIYIYIYTHIYMHTYMIHAYSICSHPGVDIRWTISKFITRMGISLKIPYSIYFRMIIYIYTLIDTYYLYYYIYIYRYHIPIYTVPILLVDTYIYIYLLIYIFYSLLYTYYHFCVSIFPGSIVLRTEMVPRTTARGRGRRRRLNARRGGNGVDTLAFGQWFNGNKDPEKPREVLD